MHLRVCEERELIELVIACGLRVDWGKIYGDTWVLGLDYSNVPRDKVYRKSQFGLFGCLKYWQRIWRIFALVTLSFFHFSFIHRLLIEYLILQALFQVLEF